MNPKQLIYKLKLQGRSQQSLATELGVTHGCVNNTIHGRIKSVPVATGIAAALREPLSVVFPDYDDPEPQRERNPSND
jgi:hypothetical protein